MYTDLKELRVRLECHFDIVTYEDSKSGEKVVNPLGAALHSVIDLLKMLEEEKGLTLPQTISSWQLRVRPRSSRLKSV